MEVFSWKKNVVFLANDLRTSIARQRQSSGQRYTAKGRWVAKNAEFADTMAQMVAVKSTITNMVPNFCNGNPGAIAAWNSAAHVEAPPKPKAPPPSTPPTP